MFVVLTNHKIKFGNLGLLLELSTRDTCKNWNNGLNIEEIYCYLFLDDNPRILLVLLLFIVTATQNVIYASVSQPFFYLVVILV